MTEITIGTVHVVDTFRSFGFSYLPTLCDGCTVKHCISQHFDDKYQRQCLLHKIIMTVMAGCHANRRREKYFL